MPESVTIKQGLGMDGSEFEPKTITGSEVTELYDELFDLKYSEDKICDCLPQYVLVFDNGEEFELKYDYGISDEIDGVSKDFSGKLKQADGNDRVKELVDSMLEE